MFTATTVAIVARTFNSVFRRLRQIVLVQLLVQQVLPVAGSVAVVARAVAACFGTIPIRDNRCAKNRAIGIDIGHVSSNFGIVETKEYAQKPTTTDQRDEKMAHAGVSHGSLFRLARCVGAVPD